MNSDPAIRKVVQVAEQAQLPVHVPVVLGNECFIITQQDVRRIEDSRVFSYNKMNAKGEFVRMDTADPNNGARDTFLANIRQPTATCNQLNMGMLSELIARACNVAATIQQQQQIHQQQQLQPATQMAMPDLVQYVQPGQLIPTITVTPAPLTDFSPATATLQQQLEWAKASNNMLTPTSMYPLHHTSATSTTEIEHSPYAPRSTETRRQYCTRACNTMDVDENLLPFSYSPHISRSANCLGARQQAKQRKMAQSGY
ncbi:PREDICTED: uncharacterized protein LOC108364981 [Rhagoletis zephyria]|uniref:uncharacterized protein LOC108364981 n=1 Tax=Rhagoletis zephyria TaxID=28612 RepID=UPI000811A166|nr:PREDICTED: uncharacterized protein LOC108364981 [Rhagoletis zephyria]